MKKLALLFVVSALIGIVAGCGGGGGGGGDTATTGVATPASVSIVTAN
jgi:hypothetical protein